MKEMLVSMVRYHALANERIIDTAAGLSNDQLHAPGTLDHGSAFDTLRHLVDVDWSWRELCTGNDVGKTYAWDRFDLDSLDSLRAFSRAEDERFRHYVDQLDDAALAGEVRLGDQSMPRWLIILHVVNHGTHHRSELARYFTEQGHSPGDLDLLDLLSATRV